MTISNQTVKVHRGDSAKLTVAVTQADGSPFEPTLEVVFRWRLTPNSHSGEDEALVRKTVGDGITVTPSGVSIVLEPADTDQVPGLYYHELKVWDAGDVATTMYGTFIIKRAVQMGDAPAPDVAEIALTGDVPVVV